MQIQGTATDDHESLNGEALVLYFPNQLLPFHIQETGQEGGGGGEGKRERGTGKIERERDRLMDS